MAVGREFQCRPDSIIPRHQNPNVQTSRNFLFVLPDVAQFSFDDNAIHYVPQVLWMTSCFHIKAPIEQNQTRRYVMFGQVHQVAATEAKLLCTTAAC